MWDKQTCEERVTILLSDGDQTASLSVGLQDLRKLCETLLLALQTTEQQFCFPEQLMEVRLWSRYSQDKNGLRSTSQSQEISFHASPGWLKPTASITIK